MIRLPQTFNTGVVPAMTGADRRYSSQEGTEKGRSWDQNSQYQRSQRQKVSRGATMEETAGPTVTLKESFEFEEMGETYVMVDSTGYGMII
jgi:hypothetical protein